MLTHPIAIGLALGLVAPSAVAAEPGVTVDPHSPAGQEYAVPIDAARLLVSPRRQGYAAAQPTAGRARGPVGAGPAGRPPLFGAGVRPAGAAGAGTEMTARDERRSPGRPPSAGPVDAPGRPSVRPTYERAADADAAAGFMAKSALVVLVGGAGLAAGGRTAARRLRGRGGAA